MKPLTDEQARILRAIRDGRFHLTEAVRYVLEGEARPERRERERALKRGLYAERWSADGVYAKDSFELTTRGQAALDAYELEEGRARG